MSFIKKIESAKRSRFAGPMAVCLGIIVIVFSEFSFYKTEELNKARNEMIASRLAVSRLLRVMLSAESSHRGYLLTARPKYKEPYVQAVRDVEAMLATIAHHYEKETQRQIEINELSKLVRQKMAELATTVEYFESGRDEWHDIVLTDIGRDLMIKIETLSRSMANRETERIERAGEVLVSTLWLNRVGIVGLVVISLSVLLAFMRQARRLETERQTRAQELLQERNRLENEVDRRTHELTEIARHLQTAREDERGRLARELHDELGGLLTAAKLDVARMRNKLATAPREVMERIGHLVSTLDAGIALKRRIIEDLRPSSLANLGLNQALEILCAEFSERSGIQVTTDLADVRLQEYAQLTVYRLVQEALTNTAKYAKAQNVTVHLTESQNWVTICVRDDGIGFDPGTVSANTHGLSGMRFRVQSGRGELTVQSSPGGGTCIVARLPAQEETPGQLRS